MIDLITDRSSWQNALSEIGNYDFYHVYDYHHLELAPGQTAMLLRYQSGNAVILLPLILRNIPNAPDNLIDATSVYGYSGPISTGATPEVAASFGRTLAGILKERGVISVFSRLHPLMDQSPLLDGLGDVSTAGYTVSVDLSKPPSEQWAEYRKGNRYDISRLLKSGFECRELSWKEYGDEFIAIYNETMRRVGASGSYFFPSAYYNELFHLDGVSTHLFGCFHGESLVCAGIFTLCGGIVQYHLSGTRENAVPAGPTRLMIDTVRVWAGDHRAHTLHLGGGVGGARDSLYTFKAGFSKQNHEFRLWKWIVDQDQYNRLCASRRVSPHTSYFPAYRSPAIPHGT
ncbi:hypothetical protein [Deinococcus yunweiensis]|uniref:hypothetical protein n=1 Tax=Deinococcus yunweiensis TaxID=367282 RepID=UPI00398F1832